VVLTDVLLATAALNALASRVAVIDATGAIVFVNDAWRRFAASHDPVAGGSAYVGSNYLAVCRRAAQTGDDSARAAACGIERVLRQGQTTFELEYPCNSPDDEQWFRMSVTRFAVDATPYLAIAHEDITARKRAEIEREALLREQERLRQAAVDANRMKDEFIAALSHELRTPLQSVLGWAAVLRHETAGVLPAHRATETIDRNARILAQLLNDILDIDRITRGRLTLEEADVDMAALAAEVAEMMRPMALESGVALAADASGPPAVVHGDSMRLQQVIWNLVANAVKFTPRGGQVRLHTRCGRERVEITVRDDGVGIEPELMPFLFERFRQGAADRARHDRGLGLGLAIVKELVELHGGTITAASEGRGKGSIFTVTLPRASEAEDSA
jgi:signal transduction histidine kinase